MASTEESPKNMKQMHLNFFELACNGSHMCTVQWKNPADSTQEKSQIDHYIWLAKLAEKGKITSIFFADVYGIFDVYQGKPDAIFAGESMCAYLDPVPLISAMPVVTKSISFGVTGSTSYICKYCISRGSGNF
jgi:alkanesulfonate monooxygenase SsuD/methylene tetrahydromethanopterin reductase-like flavin-dependent oxidoreductase (luciferase family)